MIGICISTYQRKDGRTPFYLKRALDSIYRQIYQDFHIYVIGDNYQDKEQFKELTDRPKITAWNLPKSIEREKYPFGDYRLFCTGGLNAVTQGIRHALNDGVQYICHLDHDDWWESNHLNLIQQMFILDPLFICTVSSYYGKWFPNVKLDGSIVNYIPKEGCCCASAACVNYAKTKIRGRDCFEKTGAAFPGDADLWNRLGDEIVKKKLNSYLIKVLSCHHDEEGYSLKT